MASSELVSVSTATAPASDASAIQRLSAASSCTSSYSADCSVLSASRLGSAGSPAWPPGNRASSDLKAFTSRNSRSASGSGSGTAMADSGTGTGTPASSRTSSRETRAASA